MTIPHRTMIAGSLLLATLILGGCGTGNLRGESDGASGGSSAATPTPSPSPAVSPEPTAPSEELRFPDDAYQITGSIAEIEPENGLGSIHIIEHPEDPNAGEQYVVGLRHDTVIAAWTAEGAEWRQFSELEPGMRVVVAVDGAIAESYPALAGASHVFIMRSHTDGLSDPNDLVTVTVAHSVFVQNSPPAGDDFYVFYSVAGRAPEALFFCGDDPHAPEHCEGNGATYEVRVNVPRGAELEYAVYRVPGTSPGQVELVEEGREIIDADWETRSHYRYGATNPGGYD